VYPLQKASLFYRALYIDFPTGSTNAVACHVSFAQITCLCYHLALSGSCVLWPLNVRS